MPTTTRDVLDYNGLLYFWQQLKIQLNGKVDAEAGKGLSTNDFTNELLQKLNGIAAGATRTTVENVLTSGSTTNALSAAQGKALKALIDDINDSLSELGYGDMMKSTYDPNNDGIVDNSSALQGHDASYFAQATGTNLVAAFVAATTRANLTPTDSYPTILGKLAKWYADLKPVAFSGSYTDLSNQPTIPTVTNDLTDELKAQYDAAYEYSIAPHAPVNAQPNTIETISVNGTQQTPSGTKNVNITVPTTVAQLTDAGNYALKSDITNVYKFKGSVATESALPTEGNVNGDVWNVTDTDMNYAWNGTTWDPMGSTLTVQYITNEQIDEIMAS